MMTSLRRRRGQDQATQTSARPNGRTTAPTQCLCTRTRCQCMDTEVRNIKKQKSLVERSQLADGGAGGGGKHKKKGAARDEPSDPRVALAKRILALEQSKKLSNKDRQELRKLRKEAENRGIDVEGMAKGKSRGNNNNAPAVVRDEDEEEINRLMERIKDLGTIKI